jgi:glutaredoxin-related protein
MISSVLSYSQEEPVKVAVIESETELVFSAINNTQIQQEITLEIIAKNLRGYKTPITKLVPAKDTVSLISLYSVQGKEWNYRTNHSHKPKPTEKEIAQQDEQLKGKTLKNIDGINKGIVLFYQDGCPRCAYATTYMPDNDIDFKMLDATGKTQNNKLMWNLIQTKNPEMKNVTFSVFLINGNISYNIEDLKGFTSKLKDFNLNPISN